MPVTLDLADMAPRATRTDNIVTSAALFSGTANKEWKRSKQVIQSSFSDDFLASHNVSSSSNGLVYSIYKAWSGHHHLTLRPEDIWFGILSQLNFYINAHAEELRSFFVAHEGQKELEVVEMGTIRSVDFGELAIRMTRQIEKSVLDPELRTWIMPEFSTTTKSDRVVASILMMGTLQKYFTYLMSLSCGIPSVTLLGERRDWQLLLDKLDKIPQLGAEPAQFATLLRPILQRFVRTFDNPSDPSLVDFWNTLAHQSGGSGPSYLSGWVTAFCFWDEDGKTLYGDPQRPVTARQAGAELDGVLFHRVDTDCIPAGHASVPVKVDDNGKIYNTKMLAGSVGIMASSSGMRLDRSHMGGLSIDKDEHGRMIRRSRVPAKRAEAMGEPGLDSLRPLTGWWMYEVEGEEEVEKRKQILEDKKKAFGMMERQGYKHGTEEFKQWIGLMNEIQALESF